MPASRLSRHCSPGAITLCLLAGVVPVSGIVSALSAQEPQRQRYDYESDLGRMTKGPDGETIFHLDGNAHFWNDDVDITGDRGRYYATARRVEVIGSVKVVSDSLDLWCDSLVAFEDYSRACASRDEEDAAMHTRLADGTARARGAMEELLDALCDHEGIDI